MSNSFINLILSLSEKALKFLYRDYNELDFLKSISSKEAFAQKTIATLEQRFIDSFSVLDSFDIVFNGVKNDDTAEVTCYVNLIDSYSNFCRSLPYFATTIFLTRSGQQDKNCCIVYFPILGEYIYTFSGMNNVFFVRNHQKDGVRKLYFTSSDKSFTASKNHGKIIALETSTNAISNFIAINNDDRNQYKMFGSAAFALSLFLRQKVDEVIVQSPNYAVLEASKLLLKESQARYVVVEDETIRTTN